MKRLCISAFLVFSAIFVHANTSTNRFGLVQISTVTGDIWGQTTNNNWGTVDSAVAGLSTYNLYTTTNAFYGPVQFSTQTISPGSCLTINSTGTLTTQSCGGGGGASALSVGLGTSAGTNLQLSTPTSSILFNPNQFTGGTTGAATSYINLNPGTTYFVSTNPGSQQSANISVTTATVGALTATSITVSTLTVSSSATISNVNLSGNTLAYSSGTFLNSVAVGTTNVNGQPLRVIDTNGSGIESFESATNETMYFNMKNNTAGTSANMAQQLVGTGGDSATGALAGDSELKAANNLYLVAGGASAKSALYISSTTGVFVSSINFPSGVQTVAFTGDASVPLISSGIAFGSSLNAITQDTSSLAWNDSIKQLAVDAGNTGFNSGAITISTVVINGNMKTAGFIVVYQHYAYVSAFNGGSLSTFDVSNPTSPVLLSQLTGGNLVGAEGFEISGQYLYLCSLTSNAFLVFDISTPGFPKLVASIVDTNNLYGAEHVRIVGNYAYVADYNSAGIEPGFTVIDISNPLSPVIVSSITSSNITAPIYMQIRYPYAYITNEDSTCHLNVINISTPTNPSLVNTTTITGCGSNALGFDFYGRYLYMGSDITNGLFVMDVSTPTSPVFVSSNTSAGAYTFTTLKVVGNKLFGTSTAADAFFQFSLANPANPTFINSIQDINKLVGPDDLFINGNYAYTSNHGPSPSGGLSIINIGSLEIPSIEAGSIKADEIETTHDLRTNRVFSDTSINTPVLAAQSVSASNVKVSSLTVSTVINASYVTGTQCLHSVGGVVTGAGADCQISGINNTSTLQSGATFYTSSGTVAGQLTVEGSPASGNIFSVGYPGFINTIAVQNGVVGIGKATTGNAVDVNGNVVASNHMSAPYFSSQNNLAPALAITASGANYGLIGNYFKNGWSIGYGSDPTVLETPVLEWDSSPAVNVVSSMTVQGANGINATYGIAGGSGTFTTSLTVGGQNVCQANGTNCPTYGLLSSSQTWTGSQTFKSSTTFSTSNITVSISSNGYVGSTGGSAPTFSGCGTSPTVTAGSNNMRGSVTMTSGLSSACTMTPATPVPQNYFCTFGCLDPLAATSCGQSAALTVSCYGAAGLTTCTAGDFVSWICSGTN